MRITQFVLSAWMTTGLCAALAAQPSAHPDGSASPASAKSAGVVFKIGTFDRSSAEFAGGSPANPVRFVAGQDNPATAWYASQPAASTSAGHPPDAASAPREIVFSLAASRAKTYRLHVSFLIESASVPALRVTINGKSGRFYLHPKLDLNMGDDIAAFDPEYSHADLVFDFPGSDLHAGSNTVSLQAVEEAAQSVPDARLTYDAIELDPLPNAGSAQPASAQTAQIVPTIFYQQQANQLNEILDVFVTSSAPFHSGEVALAIGGKTYRQHLASHQDFGDEKLEFAVPEFTSPAQARLSWPGPGRLRHETVAVVPQKKWTLFLIPHVHLDVGYTDYQSKVAAIQSRILDEAMALTAQHPDFRFSTDGEWNLDQFWKTRTAAEQQRIVAAIQKQQLFVPAQYANLLTGFPTAETLIRSLYPSANFSRMYGTPFNYANITDVPSYSWSYASILASAGIKYFLAGSNNDRAPVLLQGRLNQNSPMWWEGPDGGKVLFWYSRHYMQMQLLFGLPPLVAAGHETLPQFLQMYQRPAYRADAAIIFGTQVENTDLYPQQAELVRQWNHAYAYPRMQYSGFHDALKNIARQFGDAIPTMRGDGGPYWEDGIGSDAYYAAVERENESRGPSADKLATLTSLVNPRVAADKHDLDRMWTDMVLMDEHTWTSWNSIDDPTSAEAVKQLAVKDSRALEARLLASSVAQNSMATLADSISAAPGSLIVFNTLNWKRSGLVSLDLYNKDEIVDTSTGSVVPFEIVRSGHHFRRVRFVASDVPPVGYKVFLLRRADKPQPPATVTQSAVMESKYYRVQLDPQSGAVHSIFDKQLGRELVDQHSTYKFGQYLYVTGGNHLPNSLMQYRVVSKEPKLDVHPSAQGKLISVTRTPYGWSARLESTDTNTPSIQTEIRVFDHEKKIEFVENINKKEVDTNEGVYFAFPFAVDHPEFDYEIQNGVVNPAKDMYPGAGHEWFSVQHWVSVRNAAVSATVMPLDTALVTLGDINRGAWPTQFGDRPATIFSYAMNNYWHTNYRAGQGGNFRFRYVIASAAASTDAPELSRLGWEEMTPLEKDEVSSQDKALEVKRPLSGKQASFLNVPDPDLLLEDWKPAEDGSGTILRFLDLGGTARTVTVDFPLLQLEHAWSTDAVERDPQPIPLTGSHGFQMAVHPHQIVTIKVAKRD